MNRITANSNKSNPEEIDHWHENPQLFLPGVNVNCIIYAFHDTQLKILLHKVLEDSKWMLPGGFIFLNESINDAVQRILTLRTGLEDVPLKQFYTFGDADRSKRDQDAKELSEAIAKNKSFQYTQPDWFGQRFVTISYFAFVDYNEVKTKAMYDETLQWCHIQELPDLYADHNDIVEEALKELRRHLGRVAFGIELLPEKFTMTELRTIYETILDRKLDRRNFQRKMLSTGYIIKLNEMIEKQGIRASNLFMFDEENYHNGFSIFE